MVESMEDSPFGASVPKFALQYWVPSFTSRSLRMVLVVEESVSGKIFLEIFLFCVATSFF